MSSSPCRADEFECARRLDHPVHPNPVLRVTGKVRRRNSVEGRDKFCDPHHRRNASTVSVLFCTHLLQVLGSSARAMHRKERLRYEQEA
jgi:uncharacterized DUF497 family protein